MTSAFKKVFVAASFTVISLALLPACNNSSEKKEDDTVVDTSQYKKDQWADTTKTDTAQFKKDQWADTLKK